MKTTIDVLKRLYLENKLSHVNLIETNNQNFCFEDLLSLVQLISCNEDYSDKCDKCNMCNNIKKNESLNFFVIKPDGKNIKKEQLIELKLKCSTIPYLSKNNVYIICNAEKLNASSSNTLLKFIEEPYEHCFGFFITSNKDNIINTIKSRCNVYSLVYENNTLKEQLNIEEDDFNCIKLDILEYLENVMVDYNLLYNKTILKEKYKEKETCFIFFKVMLDIVDNYIESCTNKEFKNKYSEFDTIIVTNLKDLISKKKIIINILNDLSYNLNIDLIFDRFIIELGEENEKIVCSVS